MINTENIVAADATPSKLAERGWLLEFTLVLFALTLTTALFFNEIVFFGRTLLPLQAPGVMGSKGPYGFNGKFRPDVFRIDPGASAWQHEPWAREVGNQYASGSFPIWNEHQGFGFPLLADGISGVLDPFRLPVLLSDSALAWDFYYLAMVIFGGTATYYFGRTMGLAGPVRLFIAVAYVFSGHFMVFGNNMWNVAYYLLPVILIGSELILAGRVRLGFVLTALAVCLDLFVGMPEVTLIVFLFSIAYGGYQLLILGFSSKTRRLWLTRASYLAGAWIVGVGLATPFILSLFELVANSSKMAIGRSTTGLDFEPLNHFVYWFVPFLNGPPMATAPGNRINDWVGATVLILAFYALRPSKEKLYVRIVPFAFLALVVMFAKTFGMPVLNDIGNLPGLNVTLFQKWSAPVSAFLLALLGGIGFQRLLTERARSASVFWIFLTFNSLLLVGLLLNRAQVGSALPTHLWFTVGVAFFFATTICIVILARDRLNRVSISLALCISVILELFLFAPHNAYQDRYDRFVEPPYVSFLKNQKALERVRIFATDGILFPDTSSAFGLSDIRALDALYLDRYLAYVQHFLSTGVWHSFSGDPHMFDGTQTQFLGNPWFDLTGVRFIITNVGSKYSDLINSGVLSDIIDKSAKLDPYPSSIINVRPMTVNGVTRTTLFEHPPASIRYPTRIAKGEPKLEFSLALDPEVWDQSKGDGVSFEVAVLSGDRREDIYRREIDPKNDPSQRQWIEDSVDLSSYAGQDVTLVFATNPQLSSGYDWAGWGDIRLSVAETPSPSKQFVRVYDGEVQIFENRDAMPRVFLVSNVIPVASFEMAIETMAQHQIDPSSTAIVEGISEDQAVSLGSKGGSASFSRFSPTDIDIDVEASDPSFLILTDSHYPGWEATIDGQATPIYATDLAFRGLFVPEGQHKVQFSYRPGSFRIGLAIASVAMTVLVLVLVGPTLFHRFSRTRI